MTVSEERRIEFTGTGFQALGWGLLAVVASMLIIPAAWGAAALYRWGVRSLSFSDGTRASFEGRGGQVWGYFVLAALVGLVPQVSQAIEDQNTATLVSILLPFLLLPISAAISLQIVRWFFANIKWSSGVDLKFTGGYGPYLGWLLLVSLSVFTIIGWAWAMVAMVRWMCRKIDAGENRVAFFGSGWGLLWRGVLASLASVLIIPIPWVWVWVVRWMTRNLVITREVEGS
jgi:hypothetical protein